MLILMYIYIAVHCGLAVKGTLHSIIKDDQMFLNLQKYSNIKMNPRPMSLILCINPAICLNLKLMEKISAE